MLSTILVTLIGGVILGVLGRMLAPGRQNIPFWATVLAGIIGMIAGSLLYYWIIGVQSGYNGSWDDTTRGIDWWRHIWQVVASVIAVIGVSAALGRTKRV